MHHYYSEIHYILNAKSNFWDAFVGIVTLGAVIVALFGERFWEWWRRPIIEAQFDSQSERCYRMAIATPDSIFDQGTFKEIKRQYFRLKVSNKGLSTVKGLRAKVELYDIDRSMLADRFEPNALNWITGSGSIDLAPGEDDYLNFISQALEPENVKYKLRIEVANHTLRGITWDRYLTAHILRVIFHADNLTKPVIKFFKFTPTESMGKLEESSSW